MKTSAALVALVALASVQAGRAADTIPTTLYTDPATGVSFRYPTAWKRVQQVSGMQGTEGIDWKHPPAAIFEFRPTGTYKKTSLDALDFLYGTFPGLDAATCRKLTQNVQNNLMREPAQVILNGTTYAHGGGGAVGLGHGLAADVYTTFHNGGCVVFEEDFSTVAADPDAGTHYLSQTQARTLNRLLRSILPTVTFEPQHP